MVSVLTQDLNCFFEGKGKKDYGLPSKSAGWVTLVTVYETGEICLLGSLLLLQHATKKDIAYWKRVSYLRVDPSQKSKLQVFWERATGIWETARKS